VLSVLAVARVWLFGLYASAHTQLVCPFSTATLNQSKASHILAVLSRLPVAMVSPSG